MRRSIITLLAAVAVLAASLQFAPPGENLAAAATKPTPTKTKDPCAAAKSKWQHTQCEEYDSSAPGDEYFGRMKLSYLGINNTFKDMAVEAGDSTTSSSIISKLNFANEALQRWATAYPHDPQLSRTYFLGVRVYRKVYTQAAQQQAWAFIQKLVKDYPHDYFGKLMKADIKNGFTEHWYAQAEPCPTPIPKGATPAPSPEASATPQPAAGGPNIQILTPPCTQPSPTPEPEASVSPSSSPLPLPSATPSTAPSPR